MAGELEPRRFGDLPYPRRVDPMERVRIGEAAPGLPCGR